MWLKSGNLLFGRVENITWPGEILDTIIFSFFHKIFKGICLMVIRLTRILFRLLVKRIPIKHAEFLWTLQYKWNNVIKWHLAPYNHSINQYSMSVIQILCCKGLRNHLRSLPKEPGFHGCIAKELDLSNWEHSWVSVSLRPLWYASELVDHCVNTLYIVFQVNPSYGL